MLTSRVTSANEVFLENITVVPAGALTGKLLENPSRHGGW